MGPPGLEGTSGRTGIAGVTGPKGEPGRIIWPPQNKTEILYAMGDKGDKGLPGPEGLMGPVGRPGLPGDEGMQGPNGAKVLFYYL